MLYVGTRNTYKNFKFFAEAVAPMLASDPTLHVVCIGGGSFSPEESSFLIALVWLGASSSAAFVTTSWPRVTRTHARLCSPRGTKDLAFRSSKHSRADVRCSSRTRAAFRKSRVMQAATLTPMTRKDCATRSPMCSEIPR